MDPRALIQTFGTLGLIAIVFAESGLLVGFFLPGDSLLFTAGLLASQGELNVAVIVIGSLAAAIAGDQVGFAFGRKVGPTLFRRPDSRFFRHENIERAQSYFERYGPKTIVLARFIPVVRTFAPILAGVGRMEYRRFVTFNVAGGVLWTCGVTIAGYTLGRSVPSIDRYLLPAIAFIVLVSVIPIGIEIVRNRRRVEVEVD